VWENEPSSPEQFKNYRLFTSVVAGEENVFCHKCGIETPDDSQFCRKCGSALTRTGGAASVFAAGPAKHEAVRPSLSDKQRVAVAILVVLFILALIVIGGNRTEDRPANIQPSSSPPSNSSTLLNDQTVRDGFASMINKSMQVRGVVTHTEGRILVVDDDSSQDPHVPPETRAAMFKRAVLDQNNVTDDMRKFGFQQVQYRIGNRTFSWDCN
jgi:hypothetical protein